MISYKYCDMYVYVIANTHICTMPEGTQCQRVNAYVSTLCVITKCFHSVLTQFNSSESNDFITYKTTKTRPIYYEYSTKHLFAHLLLLCLQKIPELMAKS